MVCNVEPQQLDLWIKDNVKRKKRKVSVEAMDEIKE